MIQSYVFNYCPAVKFLQHNHFIKMLTDLHGIFYDTLSLPLKKRLGFLDINDANIYKKYFYVDISKYVDIFPKIYSWYKKDTLNDLIYTIFNFIIDNLSNDVYFKINIKKINLSDVEIKYINPFLKSVFIKSFEIAKKILLDKILIYNLQNNLIFIQSHSRRDKNDVEMTNDNFNFILDIIIKKMGSDVTGKIKRCNNFKSIKIDGITKKK